MAAAADPFPSETDHTAPESGNTDPEDDANNDKTESMTIKISIGGKVFKADIEDSETWKAFLEKLPFVLNMRELHGNEKYCYGVTLPSADKY